MSDALTCEKAVDINCMRVDFGAGKSSTGFEKSMGKSKPRPIMLKVRPQHASLMGREVCVAGDFRALALEPQQSFENG
jgi:hypothetical protein